MQEPSTSPVSSPLPSVAERLLVLWLSLTFLLCVFAALPAQYTASTFPALRRNARVYLRTLGIDQYWRLFAGNWDIPQLRVVAAKRSGEQIDATRLFLRQGILYRHVLDDRMEVSHIVLAGGPTAPLLASYANAVRRELGPDTVAVRFEQVYRTPRVRSGSAEPRTAFPLATYRWDQPRRLPNP
jgi:hypothetical protein